MAACLWWQDYKEISISAGPGVAKLRRSKSPNISSDVARVAGTPMLFDNITQSMSARPIEKRSAARGPGAPTPNPEYSHCSTPYAPLANTTVVTFNPSRALVHNACSVYMLLPSAVRHSTPRSGAATAAPTASGNAIPIEPPVFPSQSCGATPRDAAIIPRPDVIASSTTMQFSGSNAATVVASPANVISPVAAAGRSAACVNTSDVSLSDNALASASSAPAASSVGLARACVTPSGGDSTLLFVGYAKYETGIGAPTRINWRNSFSVSIAWSGTYGSRCTGTRPAPRSIRGSEYGANNFAPVAEAIWPAAFRPSPCSALPVIII